MKNVRSATGYVARLTGVYAILWLGIAPLASGQAANTGVASRGTSGREIFTQQKKGPASETSSTVRPLDRPVTLDLKSVSIEDALAEVVRQSDVVLRYKREILPNRRITVHVSRVTALQALHAVLAGTGVELTVSPNGAVTLVKAPVADSTNQGSGTIKGEARNSETGTPLPNITITIVQLNKTVLSSAAGRFTFEHIPPGTYTVTARSLGYAISEQQATVTSANVTTLHLTLAPRVTQLQDLVTTATGRQQRVAIGNDIVVLNVDSIMRVAPITSVTDLISTRVPGAIVLTTSSIPGAPSRIRLRGTSSITEGNDPIVIVDGVRVFADQSTGGTTLRSRPNASTTSALGTYAGPSPLDQIDPNSIETLEVFKGPSASAMYGSDAGNGVIVITTKKGRSGQTRWRLTGELGSQSMPGTYPENYYQFGHYPGALLSPQSALCMPFSGCVQDSVIRFQALNDSRMTLLGRGARHAVTLSVSGGANSLAYSVTGSVSDEGGLIRLPGIESERFATLHGFSPPDWMQHPDRYTKWGGNSRIDIQLPKINGNIGLSSSLSHSEQGQSSMQAMLPRLASTYIDLENLGTKALLSEYYERARLGTWTLTNGVSFLLPIRRWLPLNGSAGINLRRTNNDAVTPRDYIIGSTDSVGYYSLNKGDVVNQSYNLGTSLRIPGIAPKTEIQVPIGLNVVRETRSTFTAVTNNLPLGVMEPTEFATVNGIVPTQSSVSTATYGWYIAPTVSVASRLFINPGIRLDGGTASGSNAGLSPFPKIDLSWLAIQEPDHPFLGALTMLRPRLAYGVAGVQPGPAEQLRLQRLTNVTLPGTTAPVTIGALASFGNTKLRPERSREIELGGDVELWNQRIMVNVTGYRKTRYDAIVSVPLAYSAGVLINGSAGNISTNIGTVRNTGFDGSISLRVLDTRQIGWQLTAQLHTNSNRVLSLARGQESINLGGSVIGLVQRVTPGYPLFGLWARPILGYDDVNQNGKIDLDEVRIADSLAYVGMQEPKYQMSYSTNLSLFNGRLTFNTSVDYRSGMTQTNQTTLPNAGTGMFYSPLLGSLSDPRTSLAQQAAVVAYLATSTTLAAPLLGTPYGVLQTVNTLRWNTLSVNYSVPPSISRRLSLPTVQIALQGSNLALSTNYRGKDPNVSASAIGNTVLDNGQLPQPRTWQLRLTVGN